jgi:hypothetical protein
MDINHRRLSGRFGGDYCVRACIYRLFVIENGASLFFESSVSGGLRCDFNGFPVRKLSNGLFAMTTPIDSHRISSHRITAHIDEREKEQQEAALI